MSLEYTHVDVFSESPFGGNSLAVFTDIPYLTTDQMLCITQELRHFEVIFLERKTNKNCIRARIYDQFEELPFAGHPVIGAAAVMHLKSEEAKNQSWQFELVSKTVDITTKKTDKGYFGLLDQGVPIFGGSVECRKEVAAAFGLDVRDISHSLPLEIISTGLAYLIVPVNSGALERATISNDITDLVRRVNAQFAVLFDDGNLEIRHWNNDGIIEDIATGSAAGTIGAYRLRHGLTQANKTFVLNQGRFTGRPSTIRVKPEGMSDNVDKIYVGGDVSFIGGGYINVLPRSVNL